VKDRCCGDLSAASPLSQLVRMPRLGYKSIRAEDQMKMESREEGSNESSIKQSQFDFAREEDMMEVSQHLGFKPVR
jgi:hypothetical protein